MQCRGSQPAIHSSDRFVHIMTCSRKNTILGHRGQRIRRGLAYCDARSEGCIGQKTVPPNLLVSEWTSIPRSSNPTVKSPAPFGENTLIKNLHGSVKEQEQLQIKSPVGQEALNGAYLEVFYEHNGRRLLLVGRDRDALPGSYSDTPLGPAKPLLPCFLFPG